MHHFLKKLWSEDRGQNVSEYALLLVLVSLFAAAVIGVIGPAVSSTCAKAYAAISSTSTSGSGSSAISGGGASATNSSSSNNGPGPGNGNAGGGGQGRALALGRK